MFVDLGAERLTLYGQIADPGRRLGALAVRGWIRLLVFRSASRRWFPGAERLDSLPGVAAAQFGVGAERAKGGVKGAEPGQPQLFPGMAGCPGGLRRVGVADQPQPPVGHGPDVGLAGRAEDREGFVPGGPLVRCFLAGLGTERSSGWP